MIAEDICAKINALPENERLVAVAFLIAMLYSSNTENEAHHYPWDEETPIDGSK